MGYFSRLGYISKYLPFSYLWVFRVLVGKDVKTILDIGCGDGNFMKGLAVGEKWKIIGIDIYPKSLEEAREKNVYADLIKGDIIKIAKDLVNKKQKFDLVFCSATIEHLSKKDGFILLRQVEKLASKKIIFGTPNGFMNNPKKFLGENKYQVHKSGWTQKEFEELGYKVYGAGLKGVWSEEGYARSNIPLVSISSRLLSLMLSPLLYFFPSLSEDLISLKDMGSN